MKRETFDSIRDLERQVRETQDPALAEQLRAAIRAMKTAQRTTPTPTPKCGSRFCDHPDDERCEDAANITHNLRAIGDAGFKADRATAKRIFEDGYHTGAFDGPHALGTRLYHDPGFLNKYGLTRVA